MMTHLWMWDKWPRDGFTHNAPEAWGAKNPHSRKGQRCKVVKAAKGPGPRNVLIEFEDGHKIITTQAALRYGIRRIKT